MTPKIKPVYFYTVVALVTAAVWFSLMKFARLPSGVDHRMVSTLFVPYLFLVVAICGWYETKRKKSKGGEE